MIKKISRIIALTVTLIFVITIGGVYATFNYSVSPPPQLETDLSVKLEPFSYVPGSSEMLSGEVAVTDKFVEEINKIITDDTQTQLDEIIEARKDKGGWFTINELAADDPDAAGLRELLGIDNYPELTVIIKFINGVPAYELYTTRVDIDAVDENGNYVIPEEEFQSETTFIYPVNRITFQVLADGTYSANQVTVGYSRAIYYYETPTSQSTMRTFDVTTWAEGISFDTAITMETDIIGKEITVQNIDSQKEIYFQFTIGGWTGATAGNYTFTTDIAGLTATVYNSNRQDVTGTNLTRGTYYLKLTYQTESDPEELKFTFAR